jgi:glutamate-1-semialdehyde aminotransferase
MCLLELSGEDASAALARGCAARGLLFKRSAYNFVSLAHDEAVVDTTLAVLAEVLSGLD